MKKIWEKYKVVIIIVLAISAFVALSILSERANKAMTTEALEDVTVLTEQIPNDEYSIVVIGLTFCSHCHNFNPIITKISNDYKLPLYWFDYDALEENDAEVLNDYFKDNGYSGSSPYIAVLNKGKIVTYHVGEMGKESTINFLKEANVIK